MNRRFVESVGSRVGMNWIIYNASLMSFGHKIYGKCPKCQQATIINSDYQHFNNIKKARVQCLDCTFYEDWDAKKMYGKATGEGKKPCPNCGAKWLSAKVKTENAKPYKDYAEVTCKICQKTSYVPLRWSQAANSAKPADPFFSYPLWLQNESAGNVLWAYNEDHLNYLRGYVEADLREDDGRLKWSMISRLPKWMTSAKNRKEILKAIDKLEEKFLQIKNR